MNLKKMTCLLGVMFLCLPLAAAGNFSLSFQAGIQFPSDANYKDVYGGNQFFPGVKAQLHVSDSLYAWAGIWRQQASGTTPILEAEADSCQRFVGVGAGWSGAFANQSDFHYYGEIGVMFAHYSEEALDITENGNAIGFRGAAGLRYHFSPSWFAGFGAAYANANKEIETATLETIKIKMGGFSLFLEAGVRF